VNGGVPVSYRSTLAPQGIRNLGEALIVICTLTTFPPAQGTLAYVAWEARIKELTVYVQRCTNTAYSRLHSIAQGRAQHLCTCEARLLRLCVMARRSQWRQVMHSLRLSCPNPRLLLRPQPLGSEPSLSRSVHYLLGITARSALVSRFSVRRVLWRRYVKSA
jgi:hypothetical protein